MRRLLLLTLFAASVGYHRAMRRSVNRRVEAALGGEAHRNMLQNEELRSFSPFSEGL